MTLGAHLEGQGPEKGIVPRQGRHCRGVNELGASRHHCMGIQGLLFHLSNEFIISSKFLTF